MPTILLTNDDGINADGIKALYDALKKFCRVYMVAPDRERSASSHSLTIHKPLKVQKISDSIFSVNGTPTDCVAVGATKILPERPALIVSGINHGPNLGDDITYSGTVSAAIEGTIMNIPSIAISLDVGVGSKPFFPTAAQYATTVVKTVLDGSLPYDTFLNVNVPNMPQDRISGIRITRQGKRVYDGSIHETRSPWGEIYYWIGGGTPFWEHGEDTDINAVQEGFVSITPLHLDLTNYKAVELLRRQWKS